MILLSESLVPKIITEHVFPPIPERSYDWSAVREGYEPGALIGTGPTEKAAIDDLVEQEEALPPDGWAVLLADPGAPGGFWFVGAWKERSMAERLARRCVVRPIRFLD